MSRWNLNIHYHRVVLAAIPAGATSALDVGSGNGLLSFDLAARGLEVVGIDPDEPSIDRARADPDCSDRTTFVHGDVLTYPFASGSFDLVTASAMLHHVDAVAGIRCMAELVRPGGVVVIVGFANPSGPVDRALAAAGYVFRWTRSVTGRYWEHDAPISWPPPLTIDEMRTLAESEMPGAMFKRRMSQRFSIVWSRPMTPMTSMR